MHGHERVGGIHVVVALSGFKQQFHAAPSQCFLVDRDRGERRRALGCGRNIVETDKRDVFRDPQTVRETDAHGSEGRSIGKDRLVLRFKTLNSNVLEANDYWLDTGSVLV